MRIRSVEARLVSIPLNPPRRIARRNLPWREYTLVRVLTDEGVVGVGFCLGGAPVAMFIRQIFAPRLKGRTPFETERIWEELYHEVLLSGRRGAAVRALSAVDIALWDIKGKVTGQPLARLLGGYRDRVPAYASGGYYGPDRTLRDLAAEVAGYVEAGFRAVKIKVGGAPLEEDVERVREVRRVIGDGIELMLDANNAWTNVPEALRAIRRFEEYNITWIEEPFSPDNIEGHRELAAILDTPVATGEIEATRWGFLHLIRERAADILQADAAVVGGISEWLKVAHLALAHGIPVAPHWFADLHVHCVAAVPNGMWVEYFTDTTILNVMELFASRLQVDDGYIKVPETPGHGIVLDEQAVDRWAVDEWS